MSLTQNNDHDINPDNNKPQYGVNHRNGRKVKPISKNLKLPHVAQSALAKGSKMANPAAEMIRRKIDELYSSEPSAKQEIVEATQNTARHHRSKHQQFMYALSTSGKSLAEIQTEWHRYYIHLTDNEKHEVWQEFYATASQQPSAYTTYVERHKELPPDERYPTGLHDQPVFGANSRSLPSRKSTRGIKKQLLDTISSDSQSQFKAKHHLQSLFFGLGLGSLVLIIFLFSFFNEIIIAPLIQPSRNNQNTPIILSSDEVAPSQTPQVIIPKINVQIPVVYSDPSVNEADIENSLEDGVLHYPTTSYPGQQGNAAFFGHSSNNIFNPGKYKFAFVLLHTLVPGDVFYLTFNGKIYAYKVFNRAIVSPSDVSVLDDVPGQTATATLITCDPPGTSINRLVVWGEQISPAPSTDSLPAQTNNAQAAPTLLAGDGPTLWGRITNWLDHIF